MTLTPTPRARSLRATTPRTAPPRAARFALAAAILSASLFAPTLSISQEKIPYVDAFRKWSVFVNEGGGQRSCFAATGPSADPQFSRSGRSRGDAQLMVATYPGESVSNEVSVKLGYPADGDRSITLAVDGRSFEMFNEGEEAWLMPEQDADAVAAMRRGATATIVATSTAGTQVTETYSLIGFTAALNRVSELCP